MRRVGRPRLITDEQILRAVRAAVAAHGPDVPTLVIARLAGVSEGSLFRRFATKAALLRAALAADEDEHAAFAGLALDDDGPPRDRLVVTAREFAAARARLAAADGAATPRHRRDDAARRAEERRAAEHAVLAYLRACQRRGRLAAAPDAELGAWATAYVSLLWGLPVDAPELVDEVVPVLLRSLGFVTVFAAPGRATLGFAEAS